MRNALVEATRDMQVREVLTYLYRDQPQGAAFDGLKERLLLHDDFDEVRLTALAAQRVLAHDGKRYKLTAEARMVLDRDPTILMEEFLR